MSKAVGPGDAVGWILRKCAEQLLRSIHDIIKKSGREQILSLFTKEEIKKIHQKVQCANFLKRKR